MNHDEIKFWLTFGLIWLGVAAIIMTLAISGGA